MSTEKDKPVLGISIGDTNGIGLEVIIKTFGDPRMLQYCTPIIYGNVPLMTFHRKTVDVKNFNTNPITSPDQAHPRKVNMISCVDESIKVTFGARNPEGGKAAFQSLKAMVQDAVDGKLHAMVTAPIDKFAMQSQDFKTPGHTEYITEAFKLKTALMLMVSEFFKVGLITGHLPLSHVAANISTSKIVDKTKILNTSLMNDFGIVRPKIAILGLNPHAGEDGLLGNEEKDIIMPAIEKLKADGIIAEGPYPADGFFGSRMYNSFDGVIAMYHDQGLAPFKIMNFETGVNYTAGMPVVRTSPDHGTGYSIAGRNLANENSFREAVLLASDIIKSRRREIEIHANPMRNRMVKEREL